jgi:radical SAM protein with 4Fe4S-binding SPASM domain
VCRILDKLRAEGVFYVFILGGEPFLREDIFSILEYAQSIGINTMINSNGWMIDEAIAKKLYSVGVTIVRISIDGYHSETHDKIRNKPGSWDRATKAVKHLVKSKIPRVGISPTITPDNILEISDLINWADENNVNEIQIAPFCATGRGKDLQELSDEQSLKLREIVASSKKRHKMDINAPEGIDGNHPKQSLIKHNCMVPLLSGCQGGRNCIALSPEGEVYPCILKRDSLGNILDYERLSDFLQSKEILEFRKKRVGCIGCKYEDYCAGLCWLLDSRGQIDCKVMREENEIII